MAKSKPVKTSKTSREAAASAVILPSHSLADPLGPGMLAPLFTAMIIVGCALYYARGVASVKGNELSIHLSLFTAVNAATLTGFRQARDLDAYTLAGQALTFILMLGGILFSCICGGLAVLRIARLPFKDSDLVRWTLGTTAAATLFGGLALVGENRTINECMFQSLSAFGNSGLTLGALPAMGSLRAILLLLPLSVLGGLGIPVLMDVASRMRSRQSLTIHSRTVLIWTAGTYFVITAGLFLLRIPGAHIDAETIRAGMIDASQAAINARSTGFPFEFASRLPQAVTFVLVLVMIIGASPGGTAGGIKVTTLAVITRGARDSRYGKTAGRPFAMALIWAIIYLGMLAISTTALLMAVPDIHLDRTLFLAASALGNVGLSYDPVDVSTAGLYVLSATMLLGRIAPVMMLWYLVDTTPDATIATA